MHVKQRLTLCFLSIAALFVLCLGKDDLQGWNKVKGLQGAMYIELRDNRACVKLMTNLGPQGCEAPSEEPVIAPLVHSKDLGIQFKGKRTVVVPAAEADAFLSQLLTDQQLHNQVAGVLLDPTTGRPPRHSTARKFPSAEYAPYDNQSYVWNPAGTGFNREFFGIPIYMLTSGLANEATRRATYNANNRFKGGRHMARFELTMQAEGNSLRCIRERTCLPVGGYGVWTALPDLSTNLTQARGITLLVAQMDSNAMFHDLSKAAGTSISGLIAALVAATMLARANATATYSRQLVFAALPGEGFDYMGSKRLLYEMNRNSTSVQGLRLDLIEQIVEVGQIGAAWDPAANTSTFYMHSQRESKYGSAAALVDAATAAAAAAATESPRIRIQNASATTPGIPPSSLMSFLRVNSSIAGLVITDFDSSFKSPYYQSEYDDGANSSLAMLEAIVDASLLLAHTLHSLAGGPSSTRLPLDRALALDLVSCLISGSLGLKCPLAAELMTPDVMVLSDGTASAAVTAYPGVLSWLSADPKNPYGKPNLARFLFNYLGNITAVPLPENATTNTNSSEGAPCDPVSHQCPSPYSCIGWRYGTKDTAGMGRCRNTTTSFVAVYSTRLVYQGSDWSVGDSAASWEAAHQWPDDPIWTESNWPEGTPALTMYQEESEATQVITLMVGLLLTAVTAAVSWAGMKMFERHVKVQ